MYEIFTVYKTLPEFYMEVETEGEAEEIVAELLQQRDIEDAYYQEG